MRGLVSSGFFWLYQAAAVSVYRFSVKDRKGTDLLNEGKSMASIRLEVFLVPGFLTLNHLEYIHTRKITRRWAGMYIYIGCGYSYPPFC